MNKVIFSAHDLTQNQSIPKFKKYILKSVWPGLYVKKYSLNSIRSYWTDSANIRIARKAKHKISKILTKKSLPKICLMAYVEFRITYNVGSTLNLFN